MMKKTFAVAAMIVSLLGTAVLAQTNSLSRSERERIERELEAQVARDWNSSVSVRINTSETYQISNYETGVRGQATATDRRSRRRAEVWFDTVTDPRRNTVARFDWGYGQLPDNRYDNRYDNQQSNRYIGPPSGPLASGRYTIQLVATRRMMDVGSGQLVQRSANSTLSQQWDIEDTGGGYYLVRSADTGDVWTVSGSGDSGSTVTLTSEQRNSDTQLWQVITGPDNGYYFITKRDKSLDSPSSARREGGRMQVYSRNGEANQRFLLQQLSTFDQMRADNRYRRNRGRRPLDQRDREYRRSGNTSYNSGPGRMTWRGSVDDVVELEIRGNYVREVTLSGKPVSGASASFETVLPAREVTVQLNKKRGRGEIEILEQPSPRNNYIVVLRITDARGGADDYEFELTWN